MAKTVPNNRVCAVLTVDVFGSGPVPVVNMSMSCWMRWSALSIGLVDEPRSVVGVAVEPVVRQPVRQPHPPSDDEALHQVGVEQCAGDVAVMISAARIRISNPEAVYCSSFRRAFAFEGGLQGRELVVGLIA